MTAKKVKQNAEEKDAIWASYSFKRTIVDEICNGRISIRQAYKKYQISRSSIDYWIKKFSTQEQKELFMGKKDELKKLKQRLEELEFIKDFQQDLIAEFELETGKDLAKKFLPEQLATEIEEKKKLIKRGS